jgi:hypothetical protein
MRLDTTSYESRPSKPHVIIGLGGRMRFSCLCRGFDSDSLKHTVEWNNDRKEMHLKCKAIPTKVLSIQLFINNWEDPVEMPPGEDTSGSPLKMQLRAQAKYQYGNTSFKKREVLVDGQPLVVVAAFRIYDANDLKIVEQPSLPSSEVFYDVTGFHASSDLGHATNSMWREIYLSKHVGVDAKSWNPEIFLMARCLERILSVNICHMKQEDDGPACSSMFINPLESSSDIGYQDYLYVLLLSFFHST